MIQKKITVTCKTLTTIIFLMSYSSIFATQIAIKSCSDENPLFPHIFSEVLEDDAHVVSQKKIKKNEEQGLYMDILNEVKKEFKKTGVDLTIDYDFMPWDRCLKLVEEGLIDIALAASYNDDRAKFAFYPEGAKGAADKKECLDASEINCNDYTVITLKSNPFVFNKNEHKNLPLPVRANRGYAIVKDLEKLGYKVETSKNETTGIQKMIRDGTGSVVAYNDSLPIVLKSNDIKDLILIHEEHFIRKSYFTPFSKKTTVTEAQRLQFWEITNRIYKNKALIASFLEKY